MTEVEHIIRGAYSPAAVMQNLYQKMQLPDDFAPTTRVKFADIPATLGVPGTYICRLEGGDFSHTFCFMVDADHITLISAAYCQLMVRASVSVDGKKGLPHYSLPPGHHETIVEDMTTNCYFTPLRKVYIRATARFDFYKQLQACRKDAEWFTMIFNYELTGCKIAGFERFYCDKVEEKSSK